MFSGAWRAKVLGLTDQGALAGLGQANPARHMANWETGAHGIDDTARTRMQPQTSYSLDYPPPELQDPTDYQAGYAQPPTTDPTNNEPSRDHGAHDYQWADNNVTRDVVMPTPTHQRDRGMADARKFRRPMMEASDETHSTPRFTPNESTKRSIFGLERGANSYPENNPADTVQRTPGDPNEAESPRVGWRGEPRPGYRVQRWNLRKIPHTITKFDHTPRGLRTHVAKTAGDAAIPAHPSQYISPFTALANTRIGNVLSPMLRREPRPWDESSVTDGSEQAMVESVSQYNSWGL